MSIVVREAKPDDFIAWRQLWQGYLEFAGSQLDEAITQETWARIHTANASLICRLAERDAHIVGFALCVLHEGTWVTEPLCYLEDLYVDQRSRGKGVGRALIEDLQREGREKGWAKVYWVTRTHNPARKLYEQIATQDDIVRYSVRLNAH